MKIFTPLCLILAATLTGCLATASYQRVDPPEGNVLSVHKTQATFKGFELSPCQHLTADCPDRCDHGGIYAVFTITAYCDYEKLDTYGDEKQTEFAIRLSNTRDVPDPALSPALLKVIRQLTPGEAVALDWTHVYRSYPNGLHTPERIVTRLAQ